MLSEVKVRLHMYNDDTTASVPVVEDVGTLFSPSLEKLSALYNSAESQRPSNFKHGEECIVCGEILLYPVSAMILIIGTPQMLNLGAFNVQQATSSALIVGVHLYRCK